MFRVIGNTRASVSGTAAVQSRFFVACKNNNLYKCPMKRFYFVVLMSIMCVASVFSEVNKFQAYEVSYKSQNEWGGWSDWSPWKSCNILVVMNIDNDRVNIYSQTTQEYDIIEYGNQENDNDGGITTALKCVDADGLRCDMRLRQYDDVWQLYVDYSDFIFVYNIRHK
ncbi:MAG: hypothetical protein MJZ58_00290 [Paludibacteraceae bacterium]|nr:hypothetical protein [Paludibacteraceae bacterium]